ncbi:uncharacterized protein LOC108999111 [Juglans regia]|uniref:Uncharacterized protein LOC108999111 n=1 Tax=Juglans regia TaxID=51240 RepID=A0A6P9EJW8_JUGRE|nr:uncharacterized protein LOC108999111 [Juglans regia]
MCNGEFFNKRPGEDFAYFDYLAENAQSWDTSYVYDRIEPLRTLSGGEKGKFPSQSQTNPQVQIAAPKSSSSSEANIKTCKAVITLRSGKEVDTLSNEITRKVKVSFPMHKAPVILGRPFLATSNALINCRSGILKLTFGNMTLELNVFNTCRQPQDLKEPQEVNCLESLLAE